MKKQDRDYTMTELVIIDRTVEKAERLLAALPDHVSHHFIEVHEKAIPKIANILNNGPSVKSLHIVSHGGPGKLYLGDDIVDASNLHIHGEEWTEIGQSLHQDGEILIYGCEVGLGDIGQDFLHHLAFHAGRNVYGSTRPVGHSALGGSWHLDTGSSETPVVSSMPLSFSQSRFPDVLAAPAIGTTTFGTQGVAQNFRSGSTSETNVLSSGWDVSAKVADANHTVSVSSFGTNAGILLYVATRTSNFFQQGNLTEVVFTSNDQSEFDLQSFKFQGQSNGTYTITGRKDGNDVAGATLTGTLSSSGLSTIDLSNDDDFNQIDSFKIALTGHSNARFDDIVIAAAQPPVPNVTSVFYSKHTGVLTFTGKNLEAKVGDSNDIDVSAITITGQGGNYTIQDAKDVEVASSTSFNITLTGTEKSSVDALFDKSGTTSTGGINYNIALAEDWNTGADAAKTIADQTNSVIVAKAPATGITDFNGLNETRSEYVNSFSYSNIRDTGWNITATAEGSDVIEGGNTNGGLFARGDPYSNDTGKVSKFDIKSNDGSEFDLVDFRLNASTNGTYSIRGFKDGQEVTTKAVTGTSSTSAPHDTIDLSNNDEFNEIDHFEITMGQSRFIFVDDIKIGAAVPPVPKVTSAIYSPDTGVLKVTGSQFAAKTGDANDIDVSKITFFGEAGGHHTLTSATDVEITSATEFSVTLAGNDKTTVDGLLNQAGTQSSGGQSYNVEFGEDWNTGFDASKNIATDTDNVTVVIAPSISGATYNANSGVLSVSGTNFIAKDGATNDIDVSQITLKGEGGSKHDLTSNDVEITNATTFSVTLNNADKSAVNQFFNQNGTTSTSGQTFTLDAKDDWSAAFTDGDTMDQGNTVTVASVSDPDITDASFNFDLGVLSLTGTGFVEKSGNSNDIDASLITLQGAGSNSYALKNTGDVEITSPTGAQITLTGDDLNQVRALFDANGTQSGQGAQYGLSVTDNWMTGAPAASDLVDTSDNGVTVSNYSAPAITSAAYEKDSGELVVTGTNLVPTTGANNDIDLSKISLVHGANQPIVLSGNTEITSATGFKVTLSDPVKTQVDTLLDQTGTSGSGGNYSISAAEGWIAAAAGAKDLTGNTLSVVAKPEITSITYSVGQNLLSFQGTGFQSNQNASDINASAFTFTGEGGETYKLTSTANVSITSSKAFDIDVTAQDHETLAALMNQAGKNATDGTKFSVSATDDWNTAIIVGDTSLSDVAVTVNTTTSPRIDSAKFDFTSGALELSGVGFVKKAGANNDVDSSTITVTGKGGDNYTLNDSADVEVTSYQKATINLSATDLGKVRALLDKDGTTATDGQNQLISVADNWITGAPAADNIASTKPASVTVSSVAANTKPLLDKLDGAGAQYTIGATPAILDPDVTIIDTENDSKNGGVGSYDGMVLTLARNGGVVSNDVFAFAGALRTTGSETKGQVLKGTTVIGNFDADTTPGQLVLTFGTNATTALTNETLQSITFANPSATAGTAGFSWSFKDDQLTTLIDSTSTNKQGVPLSIQTPQTNNVGNTGNTDNTGTTGGTGGPSNIVVTTSTNSAGNQVRSIEQGTSGNTGNRVSGTIETVQRDGGGTRDISNLQVTTPDGRIQTVSQLVDTVTRQRDDGQVEEQKTSVVTIDGVTTTTSTITTTQETVDPTTGTRSTVTNEVITDNSGRSLTKRKEIKQQGDSEIETTTFENNAGAGGTGASVVNLFDPTNTDLDGIAGLDNPGRVTATLPTGVGITLEGPTNPQLKSAALSTLTNAVDNRDNPSEQSLIQGAQTFLNNLAETSQLDVRTIVPTTTQNNLAAPIVISGTSTEPDSSTEAFVIDLRTLQTKAQPQLQLDNIEFASIMGEATVTGGAGANYVTADDSAQFISLGADDDQLFAGGGNDIVGSGGGDDTVDGGDGFDVTFGGEGNDNINGGSGTDAARFKDGFDKIVFTSSSDGTISAATSSEGTDTLTGIEVYIADSRVKLAKDPTNVLGDAFDEAYYLEHNADVAAAVAAGEFVSGFVHFQLLGLYEDRSMNALFDSEYYSLSNADVSQAVDAGLFKSATQHYLEYGINEGRDTASWFDSSAYVEAYTDVADSGLSALNHFMHYGQSEGRLAFATQDALV